MILLLRADWRQSKSGWAIAWWHWTRWYHAAWWAAPTPVNDRLQPCSSRGWPLYESRAPDGTRRLNCIHDMPDKGVVADIFDPGWGQVKRHDFLRLLEADLGRPYDYWGLLGFPFRRDSLQDPAAVFCSEWLGAKSLELGAPLVPNCEPHRIFPGSLSIHRYVGSLTIGDPDSWRSAE